MQEHAYELGLVFSGGGVRSIAHLGVLKALEEIGMKPDIMSGVSTGALVAALYAQGYTPDEIFNNMHDYRLQDFLLPGFPRGGFFRSKRISDKLMALFEVERVDELAIPLHIIATNVTDMEMYDFYDGPLEVALRATMAMPIIFRPVRYNDKLLVDGGLISNLPLEPLQNCCRTIMGVHVNPPLSRDVKGLGNYVIRVIKTALYANAIKNMPHCDYLLTPEGLEKFPLLRLDRNKHEIFELGYAYASRFFEKHSDDLGKLECQHT
ncbi:MAG: patatin-like phospholipase family protein [Cyclobacteriaceae bacterium]